MDTPPFTRHTGFRRSFRSVSYRTTPGSSRSFQPSRAGSTRLSAFRQPHFPGRWIGRAPDGYATSGGSAWAAARLSASSTFAADNAAGGTGPLNPWRRATAVHSSKVGYTVSDLSTINPSAASRRQVQPTPGRITNVHISLLDYWRAREDFIGGGRGSHAPSIGDRNHLYCTLWRIGSAAQALRTPPRWRELAEYTDADSSVVGDADGRYGRSTRTLWRPLR